MRKIFVFGNPLLAGDALALKVASLLKGKAKGIEFEEVQSPEELSQKGVLYIMDVAFGIERVQLIEDLDCLRAMRPVGCHDFDLAMELLLLRKLGKIGKVIIIAIPVNCPLEKAVEDVKQALGRLFSEETEKEIAEAGREIRQGKF